MTETSTTTPKRSGVVVHALHALAGHIDEHDLVGPSEISIHEKYLELAISSADARTWRESLGGSLDNIVREPALRGVPLEWVTLKGLLPSSGVRVEVRWIRQLRSVAR